MNQYIRPICLPDVTDQTRETFEGKTAKVIGWGYQSLDTTHFNPLPKKLKQLEVEVLDNKVDRNFYFCKSYYNETNYFSAIFLAKHLIMNNKFVLRRRLVKDANKNRKKGSIFFQHVF